MKRYQWLNLPDTNRTRYRLILWFCVALACVGAIALAHFTSWG